MTGGGRVLTGPAALAAGPRRVGGKAANLARLERAGVEVPPWVVIAAPAAGPSDALMAEVEAALAAAGLGGAVLAVRSSAVGEDAAGASFAGQFETVLGVDAADREALRAAIGRVLASAAGERALAYAGAGPGRAPDAPHPREPAPEAGAGDDAPGPPSDGVVPGTGGGDAARTAERGMAVVLQALVDAEASGVAFSADPVTGDRSVAVVSAVRGLGEALVSGVEDGDTVRVRLARDEPAAVVERRIARQERALRRAGTTTRWVELTGPEGEGPVISDIEALAVAAAVCRIAHALGGPQDIEWALVPDHAASPDRPSGLRAASVAPAPRRLVVLQARPITTLPTGERRVWDNSNIVESYAGVTTPLTFSFARGVYEDVYRQFCGVMGVSDALIERNREVFAHMLGLIRGRVYYNLLSWYRLLSLLPGYAFNRSFMERMMGVREKLTDPPEPQLVAGRWADLGRLVRMSVRMLRASRGLRRDVPAFHRRLDAALDPLADADLTAWVPDDLLALYRRLEDELLRHWQPPLVNDFFAMIWFGVLGRLVERWLPGEPPALVNDLLAGEGGMISTEPARRLMALAGRVAASPELGALFDREPDDASLLAALEAAPGDTAAAGFRAELRAYLRRFGDRCANELKLETVPLSEDPAFLLATIRSYRRQASTDPGASRAREAEIRRRAEARLAARLKGPRRWVFDGVLGQTRARIRDRENLRFERTRVFGVVRRIFLGFGHALVRAGRLDHPRDVLWLTTDQVFGWADGTAASLDFRPVVAARKAEFAAYEAGPAPPERFETRGPPSEADPARLAAGAATLRAGDTASGPGGGLAGIGCCPGVVRAPVRVVRDPREAGDLDGRILVAERTDPGWTLLFPSAAGILVQRGSLLSHSAIVAREMGIPCVVSVPGLMDALEDGEVVEMDGTTGAIRRAAELEGGRSGEPDHERGTAR